MCLGGALLIPQVQQRFIQHFGEAQDAWTLPRTRAPRFTATAGALMLLFVGVTMILGGWSKLTRYGFGKGELRPVSGPGCQTPHVPSLNVVTSTHTADCGGNRNACA